MTCRSCRKTGLTQQEGCRPCVQGYTFHIYHRIHRGLATEERALPGDDDENPLSLPGKRGGGRGGSGGIPARYSVLEDSAGSSDGDEEACNRGVGSGLGSGLGRRCEAAAATLEMVEPVPGMRRDCRNDSAISFDARVLRRKP